VLPSLRLHSSLFQIRPRNQKTHTDGPRRGSGLPRHSLRPNSMRRNHCESFPRRRKSQWDGTATHIPSHFPPPRQDGHLGAGIGCISEQADAVGCRDGFISLPWGYVRILEATRLFKWCAPLGDWPPGLCSDPALWKSGSEAVNHGSRRLPPTSRQLNTAGVRKYPHKSR
jgi:hypothetical protein